MPVSTSFHHLIFKAIACVRENDKLENEELGYLLSNTSVFSVYVRACK